MKRLIKNLLLILLFSILTAPGCSKKEAPKSNGTITFLSGEVKLNNKKAFIGTKIKKDDIIKTGTNSIAVIQFLQSAVITVRSNTDISIGELLLGKDKNDKIEITQNKGSTFNKIVKKGIRYRIKTPTAIAGIRGTSFDVNIENNKGRFRILTGKIRLAPVREGKADEKKTIVLHEGKKITITEKSVEKVEKITHEEKEELVKFNKIVLLPEVKKIETTEEPVKIKEISSKVIPEKLKEDIIKIEKKRTEIEKEDKKEEVKRPKKLTLDELKNRYGPLSIIKTKDGKEYIGSFKQKGNRIEVITVTGKKTFDPKSISKISRYKN